MTAVLRLSLMVPVDGPPDQQQRTLTTGALRIGRDEDNDWIIDDGSRLISRHHCTITATGGLFVIIDSSANGLFINDAQQPLGRGNSALLSDGDVLRMGNTSMSANVAEHLITDSDPFRAILPQLHAPGVPAEQQESDPLSFMAPFGVEPPSRSASMESWSDFELRPLPELYPSTQPQQPTTLPDHLPAEQEVLLPVHVRNAHIPDDWDEDLSPSRPAPPPVTPASPAAAPETTDDDVGVALVEALATIEAEILGEDEAPLLAGPPIAVLMRLKGEEAEWIGLTMASLAARIVAKLKQIKAGPSHGASNTEENLPPPSSGFHALPFTESDLK